MQETKFCLQCKLERHVHVQSPAEVDWIHVAIHIDDDDDGKTDHFVQKGKEVIYILVALRIDSFGFILIRLWIRRPHRV